MGLGGFLDGILLHQILQWHHLLASTGEHPTDTVPGLEANTLADGLFHFATWLLVSLGLFMLWRAVRGGSVRNRGTVLVGWILAGWGVFNLVEGVVDHHILQIHHVKPGPQEALFDIGFLVFGALLMLSGLLLTRSAGQSH